MVPLTPQTPTQTSVHGTPLVVPAGNEHAPLVASTGAAVDARPTRAAGIKRTAPTLNRYGTTVAMTTTPSTSSPSSPVSPDHGSVQGGRTTHHASDAVPNPAQSSAQLEY